MSTTNSKQLVKEMIDYLVEISQKSYGLLKEEFSFLFEAIDQKLQEIKQRSNGPSGDKTLVITNDNFGTHEDVDDVGEDLMDTDDEDEDIEAETEEDRAFLDDEKIEGQGALFYRALDHQRKDKCDDDPGNVNEKPEDHSAQTKKTKEHPLKRLRDRLEENLKELPVLGFNSGKYDLNAVKEFLFPVLVQNEGVQFTVKRNNSFMCLKTPHLHFLGVTNFLAPGFSYDKFLKAYKCPQTKGFFPYEWLDSLVKLEHPLLPPHKAFFSTLKKNENISDEDYQYCQQVWADNNMKTFREFLIWYSNLDVQPFGDDLEKM